MLGTKVTPIELDSKQYHQIKGVLKIMNRKIRGEKDKYSNIENKKVEDISLKFPFLEYLITLRSTISLKLNNQKPEKINE